MSRTAFVLLAAAAIARILPVASAEVLRVPPKEYTVRVAPLLTPLDEALKAEPKALEEKAAGVVLLDERVALVGEDGRALRVRNHVRKTLTDAGTRWNAEETFVYRRREQQFYVVEAETIQPDGTVQKVKDDAILVNSPQRQAQFALYDDMIEVRVIFPNVKPGSVTRIISVTEDLKARMPGEFSEQITWPGTWPKGRVHFALDLAPGIAARMRMQTVGTDVPPMVREELANGRVRLSFRKDAVLPLSDENNPAPPDQIGPCIHFSSIPEWADVSRWFLGLLKDRDILTPALASKVDEWTRGASGQEAILRLLFDRVANDVRYAGLELGDSDYQPHDCNAVWENQYGDCKDKANLLAAFLRHRGIPAFLAFVNARDAGLIDRRVPDFHVFSHVIVALPDGRGGYRFCDPTIARSRPGVLGPNDADRDVLVVSDRESEWVHTPAQGAGQLGYHFDLALKPTGELSGWLEITADGFYGASEDEAFHRLDHGESIQAAGKIAQNFYPGAEVLDVEMKPGANASDRFSLKAYLSIPRRLEQGSGQQTLSFPRTKDFFDYIGFTAERKTPFFIYRGRVNVSSVVRLPKGMVPGDVPEAYDVDSPAGPIHAQWEVTQDACRSELTLENTQSVLGTEEFKGYYGDVQALQTWLDKPLVFSFSAGPPVASLGGDSLDDFQKMPTGQGQLALANSRFPESANTSERKAALLKTIQYFPDDKTTVFQASVYLAAYDWRAGDTKGALSRLEVLLAAYRSEVRPEIYGWGRWVYALVLKGAGRDDQAADVCASVASDTSMPGNLRARCAVTGAEILRKSAPDKALAVLDAAVRLTSDVQPELYATMSHLLLREGRQPELRRRLADYVQSHPAALDDFFSRVARETRGWNDKGDDDRQREILDLVVAVYPAAGDGLRATIEATRRDREGEHAYERVRVALQAAFRQAPLADWVNAAGPDRLRGDEDYDLAIKTASGGGDVETSLRLSVQALVGLPLGPAFPLRLTRAMALADWRERASGQSDDPVLRALLGVCDDLPKGQGAYWLGQLELASHLERAGDLVPALGRAERALGDKAMPSQYREPCLTLLARCLEKTGQYEKAIETCESVEPLASKSPENAGAVLHEVYLDLYLGRPEQAQRVIGVLESVDPGLINKMEGADEARGLIALKRSGGLPGYWKRTHDWWASWDQMMQGRLPAEGIETVVPIVANKGEWAERLGAAFRAGDYDSVTRELRRTASLARWVPYGAYQFANVVELAAAMTPGMADEYRNASIRMLEAAQDDFGDVEGLRERELMLASFYLEDSRMQSTFDVVERFHKLPKVDDATNIKMNLVWASAAISHPEGRDDAIRALREDIARPSLDSSLGNVALFRARQVVVLAAALGSSGKTNEMRILLDKEADDPRITSDSAAVALFADVRSKLGAEALRDSDGPEEYHPGPRQEDEAETPAQKEKREAARLALQKQHDDEFRDAQIQVLDKRIERHEENPATYFMRGSLKLEKDDLDGAIADLGKAIEMNPKYAHAFVRRGIARTRKGDIAGALSDLDSGIGFDSTSGEAYRARADAKMRDSKPDAALLDYNKAIELSPGDALAFQGRGDCKVRMGDQDGAEKDYGQATRLGYVRPPEHRE